MSGKKYMVVLNPCGGNGRGAAVLPAVTPVFASAGATLEIRETQAAGHAAEIARTADLADCVGFCVIGGDGTIHEVVNGLMQRSDPAGVPLGILPGGTGNSLAEHLDCFDPLVAARRIVAGDVQSLDVAAVTSAGQQETYCVNIVGWGCVVDINRTAERLRALGPIRYALAALWQIARARRRSARVTLDGQVLDDRFLFAIGCNTKFTGKGMKLAPAAHLGDGKLDVVLVRSASRRELVTLFRRVFAGTHVSLPCVETRQVRAFTIDTCGNDPLNLDGELRGTTPVCVRMLPGALKVFG